MAKTTTNSMGSGVRLAAFTVPTDELTAWGRLASWWNNQSTSSLMRRMVVKGLQVELQEAEATGNATLAQQISAALLKVRSVRQQYYGVMTLLLFGEYPLTPRRAWNG